MTIRIFYQLFKIRTLNKILKQKVVNFVVKITKALCFAFFLNTFLRTFFFEGLYFLVLNVLLVVFFIFNLIFTVFLQKLKKNKVRQVT